jgi:antimicrobial peptide system SdpA family protein
MSSLQLTRRITTSAWLFIWSIAVFWVAISALPYSPLSPGLRAERGTRLVMPEGWGFFTRNPREKDLIVARRDTHGAWRLEPPHASASHWFGLDRTSRVLPIEANQILGAVKGKFSPCTNGWQSCLEAAQVYVAPRDDRRPYLCGDAALVRRAPVAWAWQHLLEPERMPTDVFRFQVRCKS